MREEIEERVERVLARVPEYVWDGKSLPVPVEDIADSVFGLLVRDEPDLARGAGRARAGRGPGAERAAAAGRAARSG